MRVKLLQGMAGVDIAYDPGHEMDVPDKVGKEWVEKGIAEAVAVKPVKKAEKRTSTKSTKK